MGQTTIPPEFAADAAVIAEQHQRVLTALHQCGIAWPAYPTRLASVAPAGVAAARAYPMQGILKYHGMSDWDWRIAFLPSVSVCNDAGSTLTRVAFDPSLTHDTLVIGGRRASGRELARVVRSLDVLRAIAGVTTHAHVVSHNVVRASRVGKGLGTSASASAALALAAIAALFGPAAAANARFVSSIARLLAGSGCRSAAGGVSLWLSYPGIAHEDSFAVRLDPPGALDALRLVTVPIDSAVALQTEEAHRDAPHSSLFRAWMRSRADEVLACLAAARAGDWRTLGRWAEIDSIRLHGITMSGGDAHKLFGWEPVNITLFRLCNQLRAEGHAVYCSTDTGPTAVFLCDAAGAEALTQRIAALDAGLEAVTGRPAGPAALVPDALACAELGIDPGTPGSGVVR
jgi:diphosphomevalonate decarboxylase